MALLAHPVSLTWDAAYPSNNVSLSYDSYDRPTTVADGTGTSTSGYDDLDLLLTSTRTYTGISGKTFNYAYYPDGSRQTMVNPAGTWTYHYDANSRPTSMASPAGTASYQYLDNGWLSKRTLPNGAYTDYAYNAIGALTGLTNKNSGGSTLSSYGTFVYDGVFNLKNVTGSVTGQSTLSGTQTWTYDTKDRLLSEVGTRLGGYTQNFGYDNSGNPTTFKGIGQTFNSDNQRSATGYVFDGNGNPTTYAGTALTFDPENRVTGIGASWTAGYGADDLRAWKQVSGTRTYYLYDGTDPVAEMNSSGTVTATNSFGPDGLVARQQSGAWIQYQFDQQGNVSQRLNASQTVLSSSVYDAYGLESNVGSPTDTFGFNAQWGYLFDRENGLYACSYRQYDPNQGRWINRDPIGYEGGVNVYGYCEASPNQNIDPLGHSRLTYLYELIERITGKVLKNGVTYTPKTRYPKHYYEENNAFMRILESSEDRAAMRAKEMAKTKAAGPGELPLSNEPWSPNGKAKKAAIEAAKGGGLIATFVGVIKECVELLDPTPIGLAMDAGKAVGPIIQPWVNRNQSKNWKGGMRHGWDDWLDENGG